MSIITIQESKCTKCGVCQKSCPIGILVSSRENGYPTIMAEHEGKCVHCGHCDTVCPQDALVHELSQQAQIVTIEGSTAVDAKALALHFKNRRSIRNFQSRQIERSVFEQIFDIVRYAPTGTNQQKNAWVVISEPSIVAQLAEGTINWMRLVQQHKPEMAQRLNCAALIASFERGIDRICRNAPHIVVCHTPAAHAVGVKDADIATAHFELIAPSFGIGTCWAGYLMIALQNSEELRKIIGLDNTVAVHSALMLGYPKYRYYKTPQRKKAVVSWL